MSATDATLRDPHTEEAVAAVEQQFALLVQRARGRWRELARQVHPDLQPIGYKILSALVFGGPTTATQLVERLATDKSTLSRQITQLERLGLVVRQVDGADGRARRLAATELAEERVRAARRTSRAALSGALADWSIEDVWTLTELLRRLSSGF